MPVLTIDERRRVTLPKEVVGDPDQKFIAIRTKEGILLKPLPKDPIKALQKEGGKLKGLSRAEIRKRAYEAALKEVS